MNDAELEAVIREYLPRVSHLSLSTCAENVPWSCELHFGYDDDLNLYFRSLRSRRHSREIAANPAVAGSVATQHAAVQAPLGVFFEGTARLLDADPDRRIAFDCLRERLPLDERALEESTREDGHWFYAIAVRAYYISGGFDGGPRAKYELDWAGHGST
jgi:uncharacterized protein YhbP (UPF0306 family)